MTPWTAARQASLSFTASQNFLRFMSIKLVMPSNHLILCHPLPLLLSIFPSIGVFSNESALHIRWPKYWSFSISPSNEYLRLIPFRIVWLDLLTIQRTQESSPAPQFKSISSLVLNLLYGSTLTSIYDYWNMWTSKLSHMGKRQRELRKVKEKWSGNSAKLVKEKYPKRKSIPSA